MQRVLVIGGGIVGSSAAYQLARCGIGVTLVDRADVGQATAAGAGIVAPATTHTAPDAWYPLAFRAAAFYPRLLTDLAEDGEADTGYEVVGELYVATTDAEAQRLGEIRRLIEARRHAGVANIGTVDLLSAEAARELFPPLRAGAPAIHLSGAARVNGRLIRDAMQRAAELRGAEIIRGTAEMARQGNRVTGAVVGGIRLETDAVILAGGAWSRRAGEAIGIAVDVSPQRGQILHLEMPGAATWPIVSGFHSHYMLTFPGDRVVAGATRESGTGFDARVTAGGEHEVLAEALRVAPGLAPATLLETRVGFRPVSPDGLALLGKVSEVEGLYVATGLGPTGLTIGPYAGKLAADMAQGKTPEIDLTPYAPDRFHRDEGSAHNRPQPTRE